MHACMLACKNYCWPWKAAADNQRGSAMQTASRSAGVIGGMLPGSPCALHLKESCPTRCPPRTPICSSHRALHVEK
jgi:hypothetical protein